MANEFLNRATDSQGSLIYTASNEDIDGKPTTRVHFDKPQSVQLTGSNVADALEKLSVSYRKDENELGVLRTFLESTLSADSDSVSLGGALADTLARKASTQTSKTLANKTILASNDPSYAKVSVFDVSTHVIVQSFQIVTFGEDPNLNFAYYDDYGTKQNLSLMGEANYLSGPMSVQSYGADRIKKFTHPMVSVKQIDSTAKIWEFTNKGELEFPNGFLVEATNAKTTTYNINAQVVYKVMP